MSVGVSLESIFSIVEITRTLLSALDVFYECCEIGTKVIRPEIKRAIVFFILKVFII